VKVEAANKKQVRWMIAPLVILLFALIYTFVDFGGGSATSTATSSRANPPKKSGLPQLADNTLDPLQLGTLAASQSNKYESGGRNIFRMREKQSAAATITAEPSKSDPPPPKLPPPPIPLKFYGFASKPNEQKRIFLRNEGTVYVARQGDIVERKYKIMQINNSNAIIEDMLSNNRQTIQLMAR
jgi:hypothetical protein